MRSRLSGDDLAEGKRALVLRHWPILAACVILTVHAALVWIGRDVGIIPGGDDATYILLSRSLQHFRYHDEFVLGMPVHSQYPPIFPAILAVISLLFGERYDVFLGFVALCSVSALAMLFDAVRITMGPLLALAVLALCALNPELVQFGGKLMSETPYMMFTVLAVWALARQSRSDPSQQWTSWWPILATVGAVGAALTRTIGVTMIAAVFLVWLLERRFRAAVALAVCGALMFGSWVLWTILAPVKVVGRSYIADATYRDSQQTGVMSALVGRVVSHARSYLTENLPWMLAFPTIPGTVVDNILAVLLLITLGAVGAWIMWKQARVVVVYVLAYAGVLLVWPWEVTRYAVPILPFILWLLLAGALHLSTMRRWLRPFPLVLAGAILVVAISRNAPRIRSMARCDRNAVMTSTGCYTDVQRGFFAALNFIKGATPDTAVVLTVSEGAFGYVTKRRAVLQLGVPARDSTQMLAYLRERGVDYVFLTPLRDSRLQHVSLLHEICRSLSVVKEFPPATFVLHVTRAGPLPTKNACSDLEQYEREHPALKVALSR